MPHDSTTYWVHHLAGVGLGGDADDLSNQSLHGALLRLGLNGPLEITLFLLLGAAVAALGLHRAIATHGTGQLLLAVAITGCVAVVVSPTSWQHQLLWVLLALVGRVGKKTSDRPMWPVAVILVMTLPAKMMLPNMAALFPLRDNVVLLAALAAATIVPFLFPHLGALPGADPHRLRPVPSPTRWKRVPLLPFLGRVFTRPNLLLELLLIRVGYSAYQQVRLAATGGTNAGGRTTAEHHGDRGAPLHRAVPAHRHRALGQPRRVQGGVELGLLRLLLRVVPLRRPAHRPRRALRPPAPATPAGRARRSASPPSSRSSASGSSRSPRRA